MKEREKRNKAIEEKKQELETNCGAAYKDYQNCLRVRASLSAVSEGTFADPLPFAPHQTAIQGIEDLPELLDTARREEPLDGWGGIKVATENDLKR